MAKEVSDQGRILVNGVAGKASTNVKVGDELTIRFGQRRVTAKIERIQETTKKEEAADMYTIVKDERLSESE